MTEQTPTCPLAFMSKFRFFISPAFHWCLIGGGALLRILQFLYNRALTEGEAALALNIIERSYAGLLQPLDYVQAAPIGFLLTQRFMVNALGANEIAMRIIPLLAAIASLYLFYRVAKQLLEPPSLTIAILLFAVGDHLIYFASEVKQYSTDVFWALIIVLCTLWLLNHKARFFSIILLVLLGSIAFWSSHPALFVFAACSIVILYTLVRTHDKQTLLLFVGCLIIPITSFIITYIVSLSSIAQNAQLGDFWQSSFMPLLPKNIKDITWFPYVFFRTFTFPVGLSHYTSALSGLSFIFGCLFMARFKRKLFALLFLPLLFTLIASGLHLYPFEGRLILFLTPFLLIFIAEGLEFMRQGIAQTNFAFGTLVMSVLLVYPVALSLYRVIQPRAPEELRTVMEYVSEHKESEDTIYLYYASINAYRFYAPVYGFSANYITGTESRSDWSGYFQDIDGLSGKKRTWLLFSHIASTYGVDEEKLIVAYAKQRGTLVDSCRAPGAAAYLFEF